MGTHIGEILTAVSITFTLAISITTLLYTWRKDRSSNHKQYVDGIRRAASSITAKLQRRKSLALSLHDNVQPLITDIDPFFVRERNPIAARDQLWRGLVAERTKLNERILSEDIENAIVDLYAYDSMARRLFGSTVELITRIENSLFSDLIHETQTAILKRGSSPVRSAELGNELRAICREKSIQLGNLFEAILDPVRRELLKIIEADAEALVSKQVGLSSPEDILPPLNELAGAMEVPSWTKTIEYRPECVYHPSRILFEDTIGDGDVSPVPRLVESQPKLCVLEGEIELLRKTFTGCRSIYDTMVLDTLIPHYEESFIVAPGNERPYPSVNTKSLQPPLKRR